VEAYVEEVGQLLLGDADPVVSHDEMDLAVIMWRRSEGHQDGALRRSEFDSIGDQIVQDLPKSG